MSGFGVLSMNSNEPAVLIQTFATQLAVEGRSEGAGDLPDPLPSELESSRARRLVARPAGVSVA
jgi:hypothetical protein